MLADTRARKWPRAAPIGEPGVVMTQRRRGEPTATWALPNLRATTPSLEGAVSEKMMYAWVTGGHIPFFFRWQVPCFFPLRFSGHQSQSVCSGCSPLHLTLQARPARDYTTSH